MTSPTIPVSPSCHNQRRFADFVIGERQTWRLISLTEGHITTQLQQSDVIFCEVMGGLSRVVGVDDDVIDWVGVRIGNRGTQRMYPNDHRVCGGFVAARRKFKPEGIPVSVTLDVSGSPMDFQWGNIQGNLTGMEPSIIRFTMLSKTKFVSMPSSMLAT